MICNASANEVMAQLFLGTTKFIALHNDDPTQNGLIATEMAGGSYARKPMTFTDPSGRSVLTTEGVWWADLPNTPIRYIAVWTAISGGTMIGYQLVSAPGVIVPAGKRFVVAAGDFGFTLN